MMTIKETFTAAILGIACGIILAIGFMHVVDSRIDHTAIQEAL